MSKKLSVVTLATKSYIRIIDDYFLSTLPKDVKDMKILFMNNMDNVPRSEAVDFEIKKLNMIIEEIKINMGNNLFFIDGDVVFSGLQFTDEVNDLLQKNDLLFQFNDLWYNFGIFAVSCNENTLEFFEHFVNVEMPKAHNCPGLHDQHIVNAMLSILHPNAGLEVPVEKTFDHLVHQALPIKYFANHFENYKYPAGVPSDVVFLHATNTINMPHKLAILTDFKNNYYDARR